jgi:hypothetical protein
MPLGKLMGTLLLVTAMPAMADTAASTWQEDDNGQLQLDNSALGTWCYTKNNQVKQRIRDATVYERNQNCYRRNPPDCIVFSPTGYRTMTSECSMTKIAGAEAYKNVVVTYKCEQSEALLAPSTEPKRHWTERAEMGFTSDDYLYIIRRVIP